MRDIRRALPLIKVYDFFAVPQKEDRDVAGQEEDVVGFALNETKARNLKLRRVVDAMRTKAGGGGRVLSRKRHWTVTYRTKTCSRYRRSPQTEEY